ncbi:hypothetical protein MTO96_020136, partial [Rhipicephalus appendiculatus]
PFGQIPANEKEKVAAVDKIKNGQHVSGWEERKTIIKYHTGYNRDQAVVSSEIPDKEQLRLGLIGIFVVIHATNNCFVLCVRVKKGEKAQRAPSVDVMLAGVHGSPHPKFLTQTGSPGCHPSRGGRSTGEGRMDTALSSLERRS